MAWLAEVRLSIFLILITATVGYPGAMVARIVATTGDVPPVSPVSLEPESSPIPFESGTTAFGTVLVFTRASNQQVGAASARSGAESGSRVPDCVAQTTKLNSQQKMSAASPIGRDHVGSTGVTNQPEPLAILLRIRDTAHVPDDVLTTAQADVTRIYREAGIEVLWPTAELLATESNAVRQAALTVAILTLNQAVRLDSGLAAGRVGFAARSSDGGGQLVYVIYDRVERLTGGNGVRRASVLAIAIAHEIGHLLLPSSRHSHFGLMRGEWSRTDLQLAQRELTSFTSRQGELLRTRVSASRYRLSGESIQKYRCDAHVR